MDTSPSANIGVGVAMPVLGIAAVALRFYTRRVMKNELLTDDWLLIPALVGLCTYLSKPISLLTLEAPYHWDGRESHCGSVSSSRNFERLTMEKESVFMPWATQPQ